MDDQGMVDDQDQGQGSHKGEASKKHIKQRALQALVPLIDELDESPQRKFEILMTAMRSSEEYDLLNSALDAALKIDDLSAKADALLDVINEAGYQEQRQ